MLPPGEGFHVLAEGVCPFLDVVEAGVEAIEQGRVF